MSLATLPAIFYRQHWPHWKRFQKNKRQESSFFSPIQIGIKRIKKKQNQRSTCTRSRRRKGEEIHKFKSLLHLVEGKSPFDWWDGKTSLKARHVVLLTCILYSIEVYNYRFQSIPSLKKYFCLNGTFNWMKCSDKTLKVNSEETICICYSCCLVLIYQIPQWSSRYYCFKEMFH